MDTTSLEEIDLIVVDDDELSYQEFFSAASAAGLRLVQARDGHQSLEMVIGRPAKLWLANIRLSDMSGIELLELVKAVRQGTPFYLLSDVYSTQDEIAARAAGAAGYFSKPVDRLWVDTWATMLASHAVRAGPESFVKRVHHNHLPVPRANAKPLSS
jgi:DNA-binding response OmpR family regulator